MTQSAVEFCNSNKKRLYSRPLVMNFATRQIHTRNPRHLLGFAEQSYTGWYVERKNQLDATQWFIELIIRSTCFGHYYVHLQELETKQMVYSMWQETLCLWLVVGLGWNCRVRVRVEGCCLSNKVSRATCCKQLYSIELLKMGIIMLETFWADYKFNKPLCSI